MKIKINKLPSMKKGGFFNMPFAGLLSTNPFGLIKSDTTNLDVVYNDSIKPIDREKANIEAEKGEVLFKFDAGGLFKIAGKKHYQGGTPLKVDEGDFIFSNDKTLSINKNEAEVFDLKFSKKGKRQNTPAKVLNKEVDVKKFNKFLNTFNNPNSDDIARTTAQLMLGKYMEKIGQIGYLQESKKDFPYGMPEFSQGTAPIYDSIVDDEIDKVEQYKKGGHYLPKAQLGWMGAARAAAAAQQQKKNSGYTGYSPTGDGTYYVNGVRTTPPADKTSQPAPPAPNWGLWRGDRLPIFQNRYGVTNAADKITNLDALASQIGYSGPKDNAAFQKWLYASSPENKAIIDKWHTVYDEPNIGRPSNERNRFDGKIGIRWQNILNDIVNTPIDSDIPITPADPLPGRDIKPPTLQGRPFQRPTDGKQIPELPFQGFNIGMNAQEVLSGIAPYLTAASLPTYYDMLSQKYSPNLRLDRLSNAQEVNALQQQSSLAQREMFANMDSNLAALATAGTRASEADAIARSNANINNANTQIANQESMINYEQDQQDNLFNIQNIHQTYNNNVLARQRRNEMLANAATQSMGNFMAIQNNLDTINQQATAAVIPYLSTVDTVDSEGNPIKVQVPPITFGRNRIPVPTGFGSFNAPGVTNLANTPDQADYKAAYDYFISKGVSPDKAAQSATIIFYGRSGQKGAAGYNSSNPYAAMLSGLYNFKN